MANDLKSEINKKPIVHQIKLVEINFMFRWPLSTIIGWVIWVFERLLHFLRKKSSNQNIVKSVPFTIILPKFQSTWLRPNLQLYLILVENFNSFCLQFWSFCSVKIFSFPFWKKKRKVQFEASGFSSSFEGFQFPNKIFLVWEPFFTNWISLDPSARFRSLHIPACGSKNIVSKCFLKTFQEYLPHNSCSCHALIPWVH